MATRGNLDTLGFHGIRRGSKRSYENCCTRNREFPRRTKDGANVARRSLLTHFHHRRLPRLPGRRYSKGRPLPDPQIHFHQKVAIPLPLAPESSPGMRVTCTFEALVSTLRFCIAHFISRGFQ